MGFKPKGELTVFQNVTTGMKASGRLTGKYLNVIDVMMLHEVVQTFESVYEILWCDHSNNSY